MMRWEEAENRESTWGEEGFSWNELEDEDKVDFNDGEVDQPSRVGPPGAVGGVHPQGARLPSDEPVQLVKAGVLTIQL